MTGDAPRWTDRELAAAVTAERARCVLLAERVAAEWDRKGNAGLGADAHDTAAAFRQLAAAIRRG